MTTTQPPHTDTEAVEIIEDISKNWLLNAPTWRRALVRVIAIAKRAVSDEKPEKSDKPQPNEWWKYNGVRVRIVGVMLNGRLVCEHRDGKTATLTQGDWWTHLPRCTGFDWVDPVAVPAIDPGEGWELLPVGTRQQHGDEHYVSGEWVETKCAGSEIESGSIFRRRIKPPQPSPTVKLIPIHLWPHRNTLTGSSCPVIAQSRPVGNCNVEIHSDGDGGWYVEVTE